MIADYFTPLQDMPTYCTRFKDWALKTFFTTKNQYGHPQRGDTASAESWMYNGHYCYHPDYQRDLETIKRSIQLCHVFGIAKLTVMQPGLLDHAYALGHPEIVKTRKEFESNLDAIGAAFASEGFPIAGMISQLHASESERLLEAVHSLFEGCRFSAVAMAVSAIEFRLLDFMKQLTPDAGELDRLTLGQLIGECLDEKKPFSGRLPERHRPLLELCNKFRIFSVHPKTTLIGQNEAVSVINLAFSFILDPQMRKVSADSIRYG
jgi:hypothetical protein